MTRGKAKILEAWLLAMVTLATLTGIALAASGYFIVPGHHAGELGPNDIPVTATGLEPGYSYAIYEDVDYHHNPRTPPADPNYCGNLTGYTEWFELPSPSDGNDVTHTFSVPLPDCHCQIIACYTLLYWDGQYWMWTGDERGTECVDIWSDCPPGEGCTPGYWRNHEEDWPATGFSWDDDFDTTFGVDLFDPDITLGDAIWARGGGVKKLARHGTAALLSAAHPEVGYPLSVAEVIAAVQDGDAGTLATYNELGCPID